MVSKIKCILLDDELLGLKYLKMLCEQLPEVEVVASYNNPLLFLEEQAGLDYQLVILDINMPEMDGLGVAQLLPNKGIIFSTAYKEYAVEAFDIDAIDYLTKPIKKERLQKAIHKAMRLLDKEERVDFLTVNTNKGKAILQFDSILLVTTSVTDPRDKVVWLDNQTQLTIKNMSLDKLIEQLPKKKFCRINKSEILALRAVNFFSYDEITTTLMGDNSKPIMVTLGAAFKTDFLAMM
ncbi:MAG: response regulator [Flavobacteriaceae bacterium]|jgi:DNA-binding LytR/AlgR family response regulator|nr:response regulator [Flavobacteriaceae bacterium]